jgi:mycothiol synthase
MRSVAVEHRGAHARAVDTGRGWEAELHAGAGRLDVAAGSALLGGLAAEVAAVGGGALRWRVPAPTDEHQRIATAAGLRPVRELWQMRRPLPVPATTNLPTRPFRPGVDDEAWLEVNDRAFAWHPDQGGWTHDDLAARLAEPWFDPEGFLLHEVDGRLAGFCWTKEHREVQPHLGEIFVIGVDPAFQGRGLGRDLVVAGLDHLHRRGMPEGMLYTEHDNAAAVALYAGLGFRTHHEIRVFERTVPPVDRDGAGRST